MAKKTGNPITQNTEKLDIDPSWSLVINTGGKSLIVSGALLILFLLSIFVFRVSLPLQAQDVLEKPTAPVLLYLMAAVGESLLMPGALAAYLILRSAGKNRVLLGATLWVMASIMFLVSRGQTVSLYLMSPKYIVASSETLRTLYLVSADTVIEAANMYGNISLVLFQTGSILIGSILRDAVNKRLGTLVMVSASMTIIGTLGVLFNPLAFFTLFGLILTAVWQIQVGRRFLQFRKESRTEVIE